MILMNHTVMPWTAYKTQNRLCAVYIVRDAENTKICETSGDSLKDMEHAALIAAAPETASERDRLKEINGELMVALETILESLAPLRRRVKAEAAWKDTQQ